MQPPEEDGAAEDMGENTAMSQQLSRPSLAEEIEKLGLFPLGHENQPDPPAITATNNVRATAAVPGAGFKPGATGNVERWEIHDTAVRGT